MRVVFRTDASLEIGTGHVTRCLALAQYLRGKGADCLFICRNYRGNLNLLIKSEGFELVTLDDSLINLAVNDKSDLDLLEYAERLGIDWKVDVEQTISILKSFRPTWVIIDHYAIDARWESLVRSCCSCIMVIDDLADRLHDCDVLLDQNLVVNLENRYTGKISTSCIQLLGPDYALLQSIYRDFHVSARPVESEIRRVLLFFGGINDPKLLEYSILAILALNNPDLKIDIVLPTNSPKLGLLQKSVRDTSSFTFYSGLPTLAKLMIKANFAIGAAGTTSWERCSMGLPSMVFSIADNQTAIAHGLDTVGASENLGRFEISECVEKLIHQKLFGYITDKEKTYKMAELAWRLCDAKGCERVSDILEQY